MTIPSISLRRQPARGFLFFALGLGCAAVGLWLSLFALIFVGVLFILLATSYILNPAVVLTDAAVELKNIFGLTRVRYEHDGLHRVQVEGDQIFIRKGDLRAPVTAIQKAKLHAGDWNAMLAHLEQARKLRA